MVCETKFYDTFNVSPDATIEEITKAYRGLALKWHPDKNKGNPEADAKFKELSYHFTVLKDPKTRKIYDRYGEKGIKEGGSSGHDFDATSIFKTFFGDNSQSTPRGEDTVHELELTLEQFFTGCNKKLAMKKKIICSDCKGKGGKNVMHCSGCNGSGNVTTHRQMGPFIQQISSPCNECNGTGETIKHGDKCHTCNGKKIVQDKKIFEVVVAPGSKNGSKVLFEEEGDQYPGMVSGDVIFILKQKKHSVFERDNLNLIMRLEISLVESLCGFRRLIKHLDNRQLLVEVPTGKQDVNPFCITYRSLGEVTSPNSVKCILDEGLCHPKRSDRGHIIIHFDVAFPESLSPKNISIIQSAFPPIKEISFNPADVYPSSLIQYDPKRHQNRNYEEEENHSRGHQNAQCHAQ